MKCYLLLFALILFSVASIAQHAELRSPDGKIVFSFRIKSTGPEYDVSYAGKPIIRNSPISLNFAEGGLFRDQLAMDKPRFREADEIYTLVVGKTKNINDHFTEVILPLREKTGAARQINLVVRAFNDGLAFRYSFPKQNNWKSFLLMDENTSFRLVNNPVAHALFLPNFTSSHEGVYTKIAVDAIGNDTLMDMPVLFEFPDHIYLGITEAALTDYAGMYLVKHNGLLGGKLSPLPHPGSGSVKADLPHESPWRVLLISDRVGALIESNLITDLNEPCKIPDVSWIKPGKTTFPWWNGDVVPDTINAPGNNFVTNKYYIDFCARNRIQYHSVVEYGLHEWYTNDGANFMPGPHADPTKPVPGLDMKEVCDYAHAHGVDVRVWVHWVALYPKLDSAFAIFERWGLSGMMVDFMDRDDQEMVNIQTEILQKAAAHHLHIQFHGAYKPTGLHRTWPNEFTREGTLNYEVNKWGKITPDHDINMPFTRMLAGSTDYHLGGFRAVPDSLFRIQYTRPLMVGTRCHMLGMYVVLENYLGMVCDYPEAYEGQPGFEFIQQVPTNWDETKVLDAQVDGYIIIARRKNKDWYIGAINNHEARTIRIPMRFLSAGKFRSTLFTDATDTDIHPNNLNRTEKEINASDFIELPLGKGGGAAVQLLSTE